MYSHVNQLGLRSFAAKELPALTIAFVTAELFYKFHSFTLECLAFLVTWYALSWDAILWQNINQYAFGDL